MMSLCVICFSAMIGNASAAASNDFWQYENNIKQVADPLVEQVGQAINNKDYNSFQSNMSTKMKETFNKEIFEKVANNLHTKVGDYQNKEIISVELRQQYIIVNYKAVFSNSTAPLLMRGVLVKENGKICVGGLWFNQLKPVENNAKTAK